MGKIFHLMGKSSSGKDTVYKILMAQTDVLLTPIVPYTTRPIREGEREGEEYHFTDAAGLRALEREGRVIERRDYDTVHGVWTYFTVDDGRIDLSRADYLMIGTLASYEKLREYFGENAVVPLYIEVDDGVRLARALERERTEETPCYAEVRRRFLADSADFSEENLKKAGIARRFENESIETCVREILHYIKGQDFFHHAP